MIGVHLFFDGHLYFLFLGFVYFILGEVLLWERAQWCLFVHVGLCIGTDGFEWWEEASALLVVSECLCIWADTFRPEGDVAHL